MRKGLILMAPFVVHIGLKEVDEHTNGIQPGQLAIWAGSLRLVNQWG